MKFIANGFAQFDLMKVNFHFFLLCTFLVFGEIEAGKKCPGKCVSNTSDCKSRGGKVVGYCTNDLACCDYAHPKVGTCGTTKSNLTTAIFKSPDYPEPSSGDLTCTFEFALRHDATGILVDFVDVKMDDKSFIQDGTCESDMIIFKGFHDFTPPILCGNLTNYVAVIDLGTNRTRGMNTLRIVAHMSSNKYRWLIKVSQAFSNNGLNYDHGHGNGRRTTTTHHPHRYDDDSDYGRRTTTTHHPHRYDDDSDYGRRTTTTHHPYNRYDDESDYGKRTTTTFRPRKSYRDQENSDEDEDDLTTMVDMVTTSLENEEEKNVDMALLNSRFRGDPRKNRIVNVPTFGSDGLEEAPFIVNGDETDVTRTPWQASLRIVVTPKVRKLLKLKQCTLKEGRHFCGGSIISSNAILSAAHCLHHGIKRLTWEHLDNVRVVLGDSNLCDEKTDGVQEFRVKKVYFHYGYDMKLIMNDMIIIQLDREIRFTDKVKKIKLAESGMNFEHEDALASGWGLTNLTIGHKAKTPEQLQYADDFVIGNLSECTHDQAKMYMHADPEVVLKFPKYENVFNSLICSYVGNTAVPRVVGQGDSGGPLVIRSSSNRHNGSSRKRSHSEGEPTLIGVISYMIKHDHDDEHGHHAHNVSNYVDYYQSVPFYRKWIDLVLHNFKD